MRSSSKSEMHKTLVRGVGLSAYAFSQIQAARKQPNDKRGPIVKINYEVVVHT